MDAQFYQNKEQAIEAAESMIEENNLTGVLRPSAIVQTITMNQIHATMINGDDRRAYMVLWPNHDDLVSFHREADEKNQVIIDRHAALKEKIAEMEAANDWLLTQREPSDKIVAQPPADNFELGPGVKAGEFEVKPVSNSWN